jgi:hypothetical protein
LSFTPWARWLRSSTPTHTAQRQLQAMVEQRSLSWQSALHRHPKVQAHRPHGGIRVRLLALGLFAQFFFFFLLLGQLALSFLVSVVGCSQCVLSLSMEVVWVDIAPSCPAAGRSPS